MNYYCPLCKTELVKIPGCQAMPDIGGITLFCPAPTPTKCAPQEVFGHGRTEAKAFGIIMAKYMGKRLENEPEEALPVVEEE